MCFRRPEHELGVFIVGLFSLACSRSEVICIRWSNSPRDGGRLVLPVYVRSLVNCRNPVSLERACLFYVCKNDMLLCFSSILVKPFVLISFR